MPGFKADGNALTRKIKGQCRRRGSPVHAAV